MARPRKTIEEKRAAKARYAREHARTEYPGRLIEELRAAPEASGSSMPPSDAALVGGHSMGDGAYWKYSRRAR